MTGRRPPRGSAGDPWRGARPASEKADDQPRTAQLEELSVQRVSRGRRSRLGLGPALGAVALVGLLVSGFGVLGGRPEPSATTSQGASAAAVAATPITASPLETPWIACGPDPEGLPVLELQSGSDRTPGLVALVHDPELPATEPPEYSFQGPRMAVRPDVITELWIDGGACALEWSIELIDVYTRSNWVLHEAQNPTRDPNVAAQNRFDLSAGMAELRTIGQDVQFGGVFVFRTKVVRAFWRLQIQSLELPVPSLFARPSGGEIPLVPGCDLTLTLGNRYTEQLQPCDDDLSDELLDLTLVDAGDSLVLERGDSVPVEASVTCGSVSGRSFIPEPDPDCWGGALPIPPFPIPEVPGIWTLALSTCMTAGDVANSVCGTWYARILVAGPAIVD